MQPVSKSVTYIVIFCATLASHIKLLKLPYFWDEAGYYIPSARDFFLQGKLIPVSTLTNAHPPLPAIYLSAWWKLFGFAPLVTRIAMIAVAAFALLQVYLLARHLVSQEVAVAAAILSGVYPVFFAQSSLAHADLSALALTLWGLRLYIEQKRWRCAFVFCLAVMAKETAILTPIVLFGWEVIAIAVRFSDFDSQIHLRDGSPAAIFPTATSVNDMFVLLLPLVPLTTWFAYHFWRTGHVFGNPQFFAYNVEQTLSPLRIILAGALRIWHSFGYMGMWLLTLMTMLAMRWPGIVDDSSRRERIAVSTQFLFALIIGAHIVLFSLVGGAVLARYLMPVTPLVIIIGVSTMRRRMQRWKWMVALLAVVFIANWFINPPYRFSPEDNLNYVDYVSLHQDAAHFLEARFHHSRVLTAWTATDELSKPYLGYVDKQIDVTPIENFSLEQIMLAKQQRDFDVALLFSTKYEPDRRLAPWSWWEKQTVKYFQFHKDLSPESAAQILGGEIVMRERRNGQWVAVVEIPGTANAMHSH